MLHVGNSGSDAFEMTSYAAVDIGSKLKRLFRVPRHGTIAGFELCNSINLPLICDHWKS